MAYKACSFLFTSFYGDIKDIYKEDRIYMFLGGISEMWQMELITNRNL